MRSVCFVFVFSFLLSSCGPPETPQMVGDIKILPSSEAAKIFETFPGEITARVIINYDMVQSSSIVIPTNAAPTFATFNEQTLFLWHRAANPGRNIFSDQGFSIEKAPLGRPGFNIIVEFLKSFPDPTNGGSLGPHVVAYGCLFPKDVGPSALGPEEVKVTEEILEELLDRGIEVYAGRSCNRCPAFEQSSEVDGDLPGFAIDENTGDFVAPAASWDPCYQTADNPQEDCSQLIAPLRICSFFGTN